MHTKAVFLWAAGFCISTALSETLQKAAFVPTQDPWYRAPAHLERSPPGHVFKFREAPGNLTKVVGDNCSAAYQILYRTTDNNYKPSWAVTTLLLPANKHHAEPPLLSYQIPYDSNNLDASPSATLYFDTASGPLHIPSALDDIRPALERGWFVNVPDYEGPLASFTLGVQSGHATIDSIRAVKQLRIGPGKTAKTAMWGYSGGSIATEFAAELQVQYAHDLKIDGAAFGGSVPNLTSTFLHLNGGILAGDLPNALLGLVSQNQRAEKALLSRLHESGPFNKTTFLSVKHLQVPEALQRFDHQDIGNYLKGGLEGLFESPEIKPILLASYGGHHGVPTIPLFVYKAIHDDVAPVKDTDDLVHEFCALGARIEYQRNTVGDHISEIANGGPRALDFLTKILEKSYHGVKQCEIKDVTVNVTSSA